MAAKKKGATLTGPRTGGASGRSAKGPAASGRAARQPATTPATTATGPTALTTEGTYRRPRGRPTTVREHWVRKEFLLDPAVLAEAKAHFGVSTEREAVALALEAVSFKARHMAFVRSLWGMHIDDPDQ
jgi:hypothetical protein